MAGVRRIKLGSQGLESTPASTFLDTSDVYGPFTNEILLGKALSGGVRDKVELATKFGISGIVDNKRDTRGDPAYVRAALEGSLKRLGVDSVDLYYQHRIDTRVPVEVTVGELKKLVEEGKIKYIGLSEASASTIRRAHAVSSNTAVQLEVVLVVKGCGGRNYSTCRELGIGIVAYSPLGRGFLSSGAKSFENLSDNDVRKNFPRLQGENLKHNNAIFERVSDLATRKGCSPSQLALAWVHHQGNDVCPIPGTTKIEILTRNIGALSGARYQSELYTWKNSETPPLSSWKAT
ncbi:hypothetical protein M0R45_020053 [Rubus argutus]|uniref:NADP-dependent oxidoreductase domain-containing protein n=1 Tax=Rubus argutus TaxID=59490 RepID=A0AAW1X9K3_RUBAR